MSSGANFQPILEQQHEKAFQKQRAAKTSSKAVLSGKKAYPRYWKNVGLGFTTPKEAKDGRYVDKKCPFTSDVTIRGRILKGMVISTKMRRSIVVRRHYLHYVPKYNRYEKRHRNTTVHCSPAFDVHEGDIVTFGQCRPLSKTIKFNVVAHEKNQVIGSAKKQFRMF